MSKYSSHNDKVFVKLLNKQVAKVKALISSVVHDSASDLLRDFEIYTVLYPDTQGNYLPVYTGNLFESTGIGVYEDSVLTEYEPSRYQTPFEDARNVGGAEDLQIALSQGSSMFRVGIFLVVMSAADYAVDINTAGSPADRGVGYFDRIKSATTRIVTNNVERIRPK